MFCYSHLCLHVTLPSILFVFLIEDSKTSHENSRNFMTWLCNVQKQRKLKKYRCKIALKSINCFTCNSCHSRFQQNSFPLEIYHYRFFFSCFMKNHKIVLEIVKDLPQSIYSFPRSLAGTLRWISSQLSPPNHWEAWIDKLP